jgi:AcrR family transcriptional regulator
MTKDTDTESTVQGRAAVTRKRILGTARSAFAAKGFDGTNLVADVLEPAAVSAGSFYHQFRSKSDLYSTVVQEAAAGWRTPLVSVADAGPRDIGDLVGVARSAYRAVFDAVDMHEDLVRIQMRDRYHPDPTVSGPLRGLRAGWITTLTNIYSDVLAEPAAAAELTVALALGVIAYYLDLPKAERGKVRLRLIEDLTDFTLGGLAALDDRDRGQGRGRGRGNEA